MVATFAVSTSPIRGLAVWGDHKGRPVGAKDSHTNNCCTLSVHLAPKNNLKLTKPQMAQLIVVIREISKSTGIAPDFQNSLLSSLFSGNLETASLRLIGGEGVCVANGEGTDGSDAIVPDRGRPQGSPLQRLCWRTPFVRVLPDFASAPSGLTSAPPPPPAPCPPRAPTGRA